MAPTLSYRFRKPLVAVNQLVHHRRNVAAFLLSNPLDECQGFFIQVNGQVQLCAAAIELTREPPWKNRIAVSLVVPVLRLPSTRPTRNCAPYVEPSHEPPPAGSRPSIRHPELEPALARRSIAWPAAQAFLAKELVEVVVRTDPDPDNGVAIALTDRAVLLIDPHRPDLFVAGELLET